MDRICSSEFGFVLQTSLIHPGCNILHVGLVRIGSKVISSYFLLPVEHNFTAIRSMVVGVGISRPFLVVTVIQQN
jgi:hypothetical protein